MELLFITNMLSSTSYARPYLTFQYFYHKLLHAIFHTYHISVATLLREVFYFTELTLMLFFIEGLYNQSFLSKHLLLAFEHDLQICLSNFNWLSMTIPNNSILLVSQILSSPMSFTVSSHLSLDIKSWYFLLYSN